MGRRWRSGAALIALSLSCAWAWRAPLRTARDPKLRARADGEEEEQGGISASQALNFVRDAGLLRVVADGSAIFSGARRSFGAPSMLVKYMMPNDCQQDVRYGAAAEQRMDVYYPCEARKPDGPRPVVLFFHGGAWGSGNKLFYRLFARKLADDLQSTVAVVGYPVFPSATVYGQIASLSLAMKWAGSEEGRAILGSDGVDAGIVLCGHSSGAHIAATAAVYAAEDAFAKEVGTEKRRVLVGEVPMPSSVVGIAGVYDIRRHYAYEESRGVAEYSPMKPACGGDPRSFDEVSPALLIGDMPEGAVAQLPPMLLIHGDKDTTVPWESSVGMSEALSAARARAGHDSGVDELQILQDIGHADVITELAFMEEETAAVDAMFPEIRRFVS